MRHVEDIRSLWFHIWVKPERTPARTGPLLQSEEFDARYPTYEIPGAKFLSSHTGA